ncbi:hypothetical protein JCM10908_002259 [Rhodotorula pacifica]|uniref:uncharacterized protein n=1 Tax=Rhodotorula pacifica TaxID=1495444 RepID=UPI00317222B3
MLVFLLEQLHRSPARVPVPPWAVHSVIALAAVIVLVLVSCDNHRRATKRGAIRLPLATTRNGHAPLKDGEGEGLDQEKDVERDQDAFYPKLRKRKVLTTAITTALVALELFRVGWEAAAVGPNGWRNWIERVSTVIPWTVILFLLVTSLVIDHNSSIGAIEQHWRLTVSSFVLSALAVFVSFIRVVVPRSAGLSLLPSPSLSTPVYRASLALVITSTILELVVCLLLGSIPRCAPLVHPTTGKEIVSQPSCSPISYILFMWITPVLNLAYHADLIGEDMLPSLPAADRAKNGWDRIRASEHLMDQAPKGWNALLWRIVVVNKRLFIWQIILSSMNAVLYYAPAFFLQKLVHFLETRKERAEQGDLSLHWGYVYCVGLLVGSVLETLVSGQLWFVSNSMLSTRIRVQLNTLIFNKTLRRKDVSGVSNVRTRATSAASSEDDADSDASSTSDDSDESDTTKPAGFKSKNSVTNLFAIDSERVSDFVTWSSSLYDAPIEILIGTVFLYNLIGYAALIGISVAVFFLPLNNWASRNFTVTQDKLMATRDKRVSLMNEVLSSIRMIKFYAFERAFEQRILAARADELASLRHNYFLEVSFQGIWTISPILCVLVSFWAYTSPLLMGQTLTPSTAFAALAVWNELRFALNVVPDILQSALQSLVSLRRMEAYLRMPEIDHLPPVHDLEDDQPPSIDPRPEDEPPVRFEHATVTWPSDQTAAEKKAEAEEDGVEQVKPFELQDLSIEFPKGELSLVCGRLGSGKTLLLLSLLGEVDVLAGSVSCPRSSPSAIALPSLDWDSYLTDENWIAASNVAFVPQTAWLQNASIRNNICFGLPFRAERYRATLEACSLLTDLAILEDGDQTEIGEKGINLSGGQKARVSLARAVYSRASLLLLDDILSAVDAHTAAHIYERCLKGPLLAGRTVVLVSHHVQITAAGAALVVSLVNGRVAFQGTSEEFLESDGYKAIAGGDDKDDEPAVTGAKKPIAARKASAPVTHASLAALKPKSFAQVAAQRNHTNMSTASSTEVTSASEGGEDSDSDPTIDGDEPKVNGKLTATPPEAEKKPRKLVEEEGRAVGRVSGAVWKLYLGMMGGIFFWFFFAIIFAGAKLSDVAQTWWLGVWAGASNDPDQARSTNYYLILYAILSVSAVVIETLQWFVLYSGTLRVSSKLHERLLHAVLRAPLRWFDSQALGRIVNRFSKDLEGIDASLPDNLGRSLMYFLGVITTLTVVASSAPTFLIGFAILFVAYYHHAKLFSHSAREFRRLDSVSKSPLFSVYSEAIAGVAVIRAFGSSARFMALMLERATTNVTFYWYLWGTNRWLSMRFSLLSALVVGLTGYVLIAAGDKMDAALAGFTLTFALNISNDILFLVRRYTSLELSMVGVERVKEFSEIKQEAPEIVEPRPPAHWPQGHIEVKKLRIRYAPELPDVLQDLTFSIKAGEKVGIVGSTGCGKSTLAASFFRFVEAHSGSIVIDGIDISKIGLLDLRSRLTIVPQDPVILSGSLRSTLDMFEQYDDADIFDALRRVHLIREEENPNEQDEGANRSVFWNLDTEVAEGGSNFSTGQRQLLCMARALLKRNKVLLLDEATASTDHETDELITATIRSEFSDSTLLVIAHRLRTIIDFDKVLLLDKGRLVEYESPAKLLDDPTSRFYSLCRATGKKEFAILKKMSKGKSRVTHKPRKLVRRASSKLGPDGGKNEANGSAANPK